MSQPFSTFQEFKKRYPLSVTKETMLGSGTYGKVVRVEDQLETEWVAVKISEYKGDDARSLRAEIELAKRIPRNVNIARYDACYRLETDMGTSDFAIMKYYPDGNLADLIRKTTLSPRQLNDLVQGILQGLKHLHNNRIVHRDFKPANILISRDNQGRFIPKIADFGLSKLVTEDEIDSSDFDLSDGRGTSSYKAPEQIEGGRVSFNLDLWAFGVILYEIMTGQKPFASDGRGSSEQAIKREIEKKIVSVAIPSRIGQIPEPYQSMIRRCLVKDIHDRARKEDELLDLLDGITTLFAEAGQLIKNKDFAEAITRYEAVVQKRGGSARALQGIKMCREGIEKDRIEAEAYQVQTEQREQRRIDEEQREQQKIETAIFPPQRIEEQTDIFTPGSPPKLTEPRPRITVPLINWMTLMRRALPLVAGGILVAEGLKYSQEWNKNSDEIPKTTTLDSAEIANTGITDGWPTVKTDPVSTPLIDRPRTLNTQSLHDKNLAKARQAIRQKKWAGATWFAQEALRMLPGSRDARRLLNNIRLAEQDQALKKAETQQQGSENRFQQAQVQYNNLIEQGSHAVNNNDKPLAINLFRKAEALAGVNGLSRAKAKPVYDELSARGDQFFAIEQFDSARERYQMAQAIRNTAEVQKKIKNCP